MTPLVIARRVARRVALSAGLAVVLLACGSKGEHECRATLDYEGKSAQGRGASEREARVGACWKYCGEQDGKVDEAYRRWESSGAHAHGDRFADLAEQPSLKRLMEACEARCSADVDRAKAQIVYKGCQ